MSFSEHSRSSWKPYDHYHDRRDHSHYPRERSPVREIPVYEDSEESRKHVERKNESENYFTKENNLKSDKTVCDEYSDVFRINEEHDYTSEKHPKPENDNYSKTVDSDKHFICKSPPIILDTFDDPPIQPPTESDVMAILSIASKTSSGITAENLKDVKKTIQKKKDRKKSSHSEYSDESEGKMSRDHRPNRDHERHMDNRLPGSGSANVKPSASEGIVVSHGCTESVTASILLNSVQNKGGNNPAYKPTRKRRKATVLKTSDEESDSEIDPVDIEGDPGHVTSNLLQSLNASKKPSGFSPFYASSSTDISPMNLTETPSNEKQIEVHSPLLVSLPLNQLDIKTEKDNTVKGNNDMEIEITESESQLTKPNEDVHPTYTAISSGSSSTKLIIRASQFSDTKSTVEEATNENTHKHKHKKRKKHHKLKSKEEAENINQGDRPLKLKISLTRP